jgi:phage-related holin
MNNILQISLLKQIYHAPTWKAGLYIILAAAFNFILPIANFIILLSLLIVADFITGNWAAKKRNEIITSKGWRRTITKIATYAVSIFFVHYVKVVMFVKLDFDVAYAVTLACILIELKSLLENVNTITGMDIWQVIKDKLK